MVGKCPPTHLKLDAAPSLKVNRRLSEHGDASGKNPPANTGDIRDTSSIPGSERSPGGGHGNPLQYSCVENPMHRGA